MRNFIFGCWIRWARYLVTPLNNYDPSMPTFLRVVLLTIYKNIMTVLFEFILAFCGVRNLGTLVWEVQKWCCKENSPILWHTLGWLRSRALAGPSEMGTGGRWTPSLQIWIKGSYLDQILPQYESLYPRSNISKN